MKLILSTHNVTLTKAIEDHILDKLDKLRIESEILKQKNDWQHEKNDIHHLIFKQKIFKCTCVLNTMKKKTNDRK